MKQTAFSHKLAQNTSMVHHQLIYSGSPVRRLFNIYLKKQKTGIKVYIYKQTLFSVSYQHFSAENLLHFVIRGVCDFFQQEMLKEARTSVLLQSWQVTGFVNETMGENNSHSNTCT